MVKNLKLKLKLKNLIIYNKNINKIKINLLYINNII